MMIEFKKIAVMVVCAAAFAGSAKALDAADASAWKEGFEQSVPGDQPKGFAKSWGEQGDDAFVVSNELAASGEKSLLFDRTTGSNTKMWGYAVTLPDIQKDWAVFSACFYIQGAGNDATLGMEIRDKQSKSTALASISFRGRKFVLSSAGFKTHVPLGDYKPQTWYRVTLWLPTRQGGQTQAHAMLEESDGKGGWTQPNKPQSVEAAAPANAFGPLMIVVPPEKRNFRVFMDDFQFSSRPESDRPK